MAPAFVMPSMTGRTHDVDDALFLMRLHVPCWAIAEVFGRDPMSWYRLEQGLGRFSVVGTTVKRADRFPTDLVADESIVGCKASGFLSPPQPDRSVCSGHRLLNRLDKPT